MENQAKPASSSQITLHQLMLSSDANLLGNVHGGVLLRMADETGGICAMRHAQRPCVTVAMDSMSFRQPVHVGQLLICSARISYVGQSSIEVSVHIHAEHLLTGAVTHTNSAFVVYVALGEDGRPCRVPGLMLDTEEDHKLWAEGSARQAQRLAHK